MSTGKRRLQEYFGAREQFERILDAEAAQFFYWGKAFRPEEKDMLQGAIIGLNRNNITVALGVVGRVEGAAVIVRSPLRSLKRINRVVCGDMTMP